VSPHLYFVDIQTLESVITQSERTENREHIEMIIMDKIFLDENINKIQCCRTVEDIRAVLLHLRRMFNISNIAYHAVTIFNCAIQHPIFVVTYESEWIVRYLERDYFSVDPVVACGRHKFLPFDWSELDRTSIATREFFADADRFSVGRQGVTIPIHGPANERALFTLTSNLSAETWHDQRSLLTFQLHLLAHMVHERATFVSGLRPSVMHLNLSRRELQCLQMIANGLVPKQIAGTLGLSFTAVNFYLLNARQKLSATSVAQAAVKAINLDLI
jgi:DNA-binding CsgD family transcriptional regulator